MLNTELDHQIAGEAAEQEAAQAEAEEAQNMATPIPEWNEKSKQFKAGAAWAVHHILGMLDGEIVLRKEAVKTITNDFQLDAVEIGTSTLSGFKDDLEELAREIDA